MISTRQFFYFAFTYRYFFIKESGRRCWKPMCWRPKAKAQTFKRASRDQTNRGWLFWCPINFSLSGPPSARVTWKWRRQTKVHRASGDL